MIISLEFKRYGKVVSEDVGIADGLPWKGIKELALQLMRRTHSVNVRVQIKDKWSNWLF